MIESIVGIQNTGKTLYMVYRGFLDWANGRTIYTNMDLFYPHVKITKEDMERFGQEQPVILNASFLLDEFWIWFDAYEHNQGKIVTYFFNQSSKTDTNIYMTAQHNRQNLKRIRDNLHRLTQCDRFILENDKFNRVISDKRDLGEHYNKKLYIQFLQHHRVSFSYYSDLVPQSPQYLKAKPIFKLYNTYAKVSRVKKNE